MAKIDNVKDLIESSLKEYLDTYTLELMKSMAEDVYTDTNIPSANRPQAAADAVFDYLYNNCCNVAASTFGIKNSVPKTVLYIVRQEIISALR